MEWLKQEYKYADSLKKHETKLIDGHVMYPIRVIFQKSTLFRASKGYALNDMTVYKNVLLVEMSLYLLRDEIYGAGAQAILKESHGYSKRVDPSTNHPFVNKFDTIYRLYGELIRFHDAKIPDIGRIPVGGGGDGEYGMVVRSASAELMGEYRNVEQILKAIYTLADEILKKPRELQWLSVWCKALIKWSIALLKGVIGTIEFLDFSMSDSLEVSAAKIQNCCELLGHEYKHTDAYRHGLIQSKFYSSHIISSAETIDAKLTKIANGEARDTAKLLAV
jgi:hypothetical protein